MVKKPKNHGEAWTQKDTKRIGVLARQGVHTDKIAKELGRTVDSIYSQASAKGISVKPKN